MEETRNPERTTDTQSSRNRMQSRRAVELCVLACIKHIEPGRPQQYDEREQKRHWTIERAAHSDPCASRSNRETPAEHQMREHRPTLRVRVEKDGRERDGR